MTTTTAAPAESAKQANDPVTMNATAWQPKRGMDLAEWLHQGKRLGAIGRGSAWWIGDWVNYGNTKFGEKYIRAARITGYDSQSLMNMAYVASRVDVSRRREELSWSHHAEVAALPPAEQESWLNVAKTDGLSVHRLRERLRAVRLAATGEESIEDESEESPMSTEDTVVDRHDSGPAVASHFGGGSNGNSHPVPNGNGHAAANGNGHAGPTGLRHRTIDFAVEQDDQVVCPKCGYEFADG
jgi:hypothetical protein